MINQMEIILNTETEWYDAIAACVARGLTFSAYIGKSGLYYIAFTGGY